MWFLVLALSLLGVLNATTVTVCASGCTRTTVQAAVDDALASCAVDVIEIKAGETFAGATSVPRRNCSGSVWVRSSRYLELPSVGTRVNESHAGLMPTLTHPAGTPSSTTLRFGVTEMIINSVDTATEKITLDRGTENTLAVGEAVSCMAGENDSMPSGLTSNTKYYIISHTEVSPGISDITVALTSGGASINITNTDGMSPTGYYQKPRCTKWEVTKGWRWTGIRFSTRTGELQTVPMVQIGSEETTYLTAPRDIWLDRVIVTGLLEEDGPKECIWASGTNVRISDSWIGHCKAMNGAEAHGVLVKWAAGPVQIENNYIMGSGGGIFAGGSNIHPDGVQVDNLIIRGNHIEKAAYIHFKRAAGAPSGACYYANGYGARYENSSIAISNCSGGGCYRCQSNGTWVEDTALVFRGDDYLPKAGIEFKRCRNCAIEDNLIEGVFAGPDGGVEYCFIGNQASQGRNRDGNGYSRVNVVSDVIFRNNWCKNVWRGLSYLSQEDPNFPKQQNFTADNVLITGVQFPQLSIGATAGDIPSRMVRINSDINGLQYSRVTVRPDPTSGSVSLGIWFDDFATANSAPTSGFVFRDNLIGTAAGTPLFCGSGLSCDNCNAANLGRWFDTGGPPYRIDNNALFGSTASWGSATCIGDKSTQASDAAVAFVGADTAVLANNRLSASSPYSASNGSATLLAQNGADLGVDIDELTEALSGAQSGTQRWRETERLKMEVGSTRALISYTAPSPQSCSLKVYTSAVRLDANLHGDTNIAGEQVDSRAGNIVDGTRRIFVLGTNTALTASTTYWWTLTCGSQVVPGWFRTRGAGGVTLSAGVQLSSAETLTYSVNADLSGGTTLSLATKHIVPVATGTVVYARTGTTREWSVFVAP